MNPPLLRDKVRQTMSCIFLSHRSEAKSLLIRLPAIYEDNAIELRSYGADLNDGVNKAVWTNGQMRNERAAKKALLLSNSALVGTLISRSAPPIDFKLKKGRKGTDSLLLCLISTGFAHRS